MKPGQRIRATLFLEERSDVLVVPLQAVFDDENKKIVYRAQGGNFEPVEVVLGPSSFGRVIVERGLEEGDEIALRDPARTLTDTVLAGLLGPIGGALTPSSSETPQ
jgi:multidrug efflux pump subunit AcrA (membrane-fusion protein)